MKKIQLLFTLLFCMIFASANAQTWDFTTMSEADKALCAADANWLLGTDRYCYLLELSNAPLTANGTELAYAKGLKFTAGAASEKAEGKAKIRLNYGSSRLELNGTNVAMIIPGLKAGQKVTVKCKSGKTNEARGLNATNLTPVSGSFNSTSADDQTNVGTVTADGDVQLTTSAGMYIYSVEVAENGGGGSTDPVTPSTSNDVAMNLAKNQMRVTLASNDVKYYNTESLASVDINGGNISINSANGNAADVFQGNVSRLAFAKAKEGGQSGEIDNPQGAIQISESKGWLETVYAKWAPYTGAESYNVYCNDKKIDQQLVRLYPTYVRADVLGLAAGTYNLKVVAVDKDGNEIAGSASTVSNLIVKNYSREGFAHFKSGSNGVGAYNNDGTLKAGAKVFYVTAKTAKTISTEVAGAGKCTGIQAICDAYQKGQDKTPIAFRFIGLVKKTDLDKVSSSEEGLQIKGKNAYNEMNITIEGVGDDATVHGFGFLCRNASGVEFRNFAIMRCSDDCISLDTKNSMIWIHNMDFFYGPNGSGDHAKGDGTVDLKNDSQYLTISYNRFWDTGKSSLCGMTSDTQPNYITYQHNWFDHSDSRCPRVRTMTVHVWNNYFDNVAKYGVGSTTGSSVFVENNYFRMTNRPMMSSLQGTDATGDGTFSGENGGIIKSFGNVFAENGSYFSYITYQKNNTSFDAYEASSRNEQVPASVKTLKGGTIYDNFDTNSSLMYTYNVDPAEDVPAVVTGFYGAGRINHGDFTWTFADVDGHNASSYAYDAKLGAALDNYKTTLVKVYGEGGSSSETGTENPGGGETGGGSTTEPDQPETPEGTVLCTFKDQKPSSSIFTVTGSYSTSKGTATIDGVSYNTCVKMESSTSIAFTLTESKKVTLYFADSETASIKIDGTKKTGDKSSYTETLAAGAHTITKADTRNLFGIKLENAE